MRSAVSEVDIYLAVIHHWGHRLTGGLGWIALAIVFVAGWRPIGLIFAALLFGGLRALNDVAQQFGWPIPSEFLAMLPYLGTFLVVWGAASGTGGGEAQRCAGSLRNPVHKELIEVNTQIVENESVQALLNMGRMLSDGIPYLDLRQAGERVVDLEDWFDFWMETGERC